MQINQLPAASAVASTDSLAIDNVDGTTKKITAEQLIAAIRAGSYGAPLVALNAASMTDTTRVYVYMGGETGYSDGHWYYYSGGSWVDGGAYNAAGIQVTPTLVANGDYNLSFS